MVEFTQNIRRILTDAGVSSGTCLLIGCSGGPDSVSLLDALHLVAPDLGIELAVASFNHGLRAEAAEEVEGVESLARERSLPFYSGCPKPRDRTGERTDQAWAREVRLAFLREAKEKSGADLIALAHTADDQAETVLMRLIRGSGLRGLTGMGVINGDIVRPLLETRRKDILAYLEARSLSFVNDPSNLNPKYFRVRVRQTLLPLLAQENPRIVESLCRLAQSLQADLEILKAGAGFELERLARRADRAFIFDRQAFLDLPRGMAARLVREAYCKIKGDRRRLDKDHVEAVLALAESGSGEAHLPAGFKALATPGELILAHREALLLRPLEPFLVTGPGRYPLSTGLVLEVEETAPPRRISPDPDTAHLDGDGIAWPLEVRPVRPGDRIKPLGMEGSKKVSDLYIDRKVDRYERNRIPVVLSRGEVAWVAKGALSRVFALRNDSKKAVRIRLKAASEKTSAPIG